MRAISMLSVVTLIALPLAAQSDPDKNPTSTGKLPAGWSARLDRTTATLANLSFAPMGAGLHVTTGPSGILWREADLATGSFHTIATFTQTKKPQHPEAYGLFVAGRNLNGPDASYVYVIVRGNGMYTIRKGGAIGAPSTNLTTGGDANGWLASDAVTKEDEAGKAKNVIEVSGDAATKKLTFTVNGKVVGVVDAPGGDIKGLIGLRVNHNLDLHIDGFAVHKL
jgi:hypothetical protein